MHDSTFKQKLILFLKNVHKHNKKKKKLLLPPLEVSMAPPFSLWDVPIQTHAHIPLPTRRMQDNHMMNGKSVLNLNHT